MTGSSYSTKAEGLLNPPVIEGITIDPPEAHELDDGFQIGQIEIEGNRYYQVNVIIANPAQQIDPFSQDAETAINKVATNYSVSPVRKMLAGIIPERISSLGGEGTKPCLKVSFRVSGDGSVPLDTVRFELARFRSIASLTYSEADRLISGRSDQRNEVTRQLRMAQDVAAAIVRNEQGGHCPPFRLDSFRSSYIVSTLMRQTGLLMAEYCIQNHIPAVYRNFPVAHTMDSLLQDDFLSTYGPEHELLEEIVKRKCAYYSTEPRSHSAFGERKYCQVTSPLRRAVDLMIQWNIIEHIISQAEDREPRYPFNTLRLQEILVKLNQHVILHTRSRRNEREFRDRKISQQYSTTSNEALQMMPSRLLKVIRLYIELEKPPPKGYLYQFIKFARQGAYDPATVSMCCQRLDALVSSRPLLEAYLKPLEHGYIVSSVVAQAIDSRLARGICHEEVRSIPLNMIRHGMKIRGKKLRLFRRNRQMTIVSDQGDSLAFIELSRSFPEVDRFIYLNFFSFRFRTADIDSKGNRIEPGTEILIIVPSDSSRYARRIAHSMLYGYLYGEVGNILEGKCAIIINKPSSPKQQPTRRFSPSYA